MKRPRGESVASPFPLWPRRGSRRGSNNKPERPKRPAGYRALQRVVSIRVLIVVAVVLLVALASMIAWVTQHFLAKGGVDDLTKSVRNIIRIGVQYQISSVLDGVKSVASIDNGTFSYQIHNVSANMRAAYWRHLYGLLQASPVIGSMSYGNFYGDVIGVRRVTPYDAEINITRGNTFIYFYADGLDPLKQVFNYAVDPVTINPGALLYILPNYSIFERNWWLAGINTSDGGYAWAPIDRNSQTIFTLTFSQPFYDDNGALVGVLGLHLFLPQLKLALYFLNADIGGHQITIIDNTGEIIIDSCYPQGGILATCPGIPLSLDNRQTLVESGGLYKEIASNIDSTYGGYTRLQSGDTFTSSGYWVTFERITDRQLDITAVVIISIDSYEDKIQAATMWSLVGAGGFILLAGLIAFVTSVSVTRPISRTISEMDRISMMDFISKRDAHKRSALYEINAMEKSLSRLRTALSSFEKFVPNNVIKEILSQDIEAHLGVTPWHATIFFCDIEDFTTIAEILEPQKLVELLLDFLQEMSTIILEETQGTIDKFIGDAIMAFWNAPHPVENHAEMACLAAARCQQKITQSLQPKWAESLPEGLMLNARFGVHTGDVLIGNIGSLERINYTAIGDNVNIAARLETLCKFYHARIIISGTTYEGAKDGFMCRPLDRVVVKGKSQSLILYELIAVRSEALPEQIQLCTMVEAAADLVFFNPDQDAGLAAYVELQKTYPEDVCIARVRERLERLHGTDQWPGMEIFDHK